MLKVKFTSQFKKDYKIAIKRGFDKEKMRTVIELPVTCKCRSGKEE